MPSPLQRPHATLRPLARSASPRARQAVQDLARQARRHRAVRHPFLQRLESGDLPDPRGALTEFVRHYHGYSAHFPRFLTAAMSRLEDPGHRAALQDNLLEEAGQYGAEELSELEAAGIAPAWVEGVPHPELFLRLREALGVTGDTVAEEVVCWRELFLVTLSHGSAAEAVGALGLGTEGVVRDLYRPLLTAAKRAGLDPRARTFLTLHTLVDDHHQASLARIAEDLARTPEGLRDLARGMHKALHLRAAFWDFLLDRALDGRTD